TSTSSTTSSTTPSTIPNCCSNTQLSFTTATGAGNCGSLQNARGTNILPLACGGLYTGGGGNTVPLPFTIPNNATTLTAVDSCDPFTGAIVIGELTSAQTGSNRNCSATGCLFGPPLPVPNSNSTPTSVCVVNT